MKEGIEYIVSGDANNKSVSEIKVLIEQINILLDKLTPEERMKKWKNYRHPKDLDFQKTIGKTTYTVISRFNRQADEDMVDMVNRMILDNES